MHPNVHDSPPTAGASSTAIRLQDLVERTNVSKDRTPLSDTVLVFAVPTNRTDVTANTPIRAEDLNVVDTNIQPLLLNNNPVVDPTNASALIATPNNGPYTRTTNWTNKLNGEHRWFSDSYNHARYFSTVADQLRVKLSLSGGSTAGYYNWSDVTHEMGMLNFTWDNVFESAASTSGTSEGKGFYDLTQYYGDGTDAGAADEGLLYTSSGVIQAVTDMVMAMAMAMVTAVVLGYNLVVQSFLALLVHIAVSLHPIIHSTVLNQPRSQTIW